MNEPVLKLNEHGRGSFLLMEGGEQVGEMAMAVINDQMVVYHTEVVPKEEGKGLAKLLLNAMAAYARVENLKVKPLCAYVHVQFKRHPDEYKDIWLQEN